MSVGIYTFKILADIVIVGADAHGRPQGQIVQHEHSVRYARRAAEASAPTAICTQFTAQKMSAGI